MTTRENKSGFVHSFVILMVRKYENNLVKIPHMPYKIKPLSRVCYFKYKNFQTIKAREMENIKQKYVHFSKLRKSYGERLTLLKYHKFIAI